MTGTLPLDGMRVVELSSFVATPLGGMTLAQLGADVIRVDQVGGGPDIDRWPLAPSGRSLYWAGLNKGKRSVTVDLRSPEGREVVAALVAESGIVLTNAPLREGLTYDELKASRPDLIHVQLQGTRDGGNAVDYTVNAAMGFPGITGPSGAPVNHALPAWDVACGLYMAIGLLAAERHRLRTGEGQSLRVALQDVALATAGSLGYLAEAQLGEPRQRLGDHLFGDFGRDFPTADGRVMVAVLTPRHWRDLVEATGLSEVSAALERALGADFRRVSDRFTYREASAASSPLVRVPHLRPGRGRLAEHVRPMVPLPRLRRSGRHPARRAPDGRTEPAGHRLPPGPRLPLRLADTSLPPPRPRPWANTRTRSCETS